MLRDMIGRVGALGRSRPPQAATTGPGEVKAAKPTPSRFPWEDRAIVLATIPKSGTNYIRLFLTNYIYRVHSGIQEPITYRRMHHELFPNHRADYWEDRKPYREPAGVALRDYGYTDFLYQHGTPFFAGFKGKGLLLFRNPLDVLVSSYFHFHKNQLRSEIKPEHPRQIVDIYLAGNADTYLRMKELARADNFLMFSYENAKRFPEPTFETIVRWLGLPFSRPALLDAIRFSSIPTVREEEKRGGPIHITIKENYIGFFTRSGEIGQWKEHFNASDLERITRLLDEAGVNLDEFTLE